MIRVNFILKIDSIPENEPKKLNKEKVKEVLLSFRRDLIKGSESRCSH